MLNLLLSVYSCDNWPTCLFEIWRQRKGVWQSLRKCYLSNVIKPQSARFEHADNCSFVTVHFISLSIMYKGLDAFGERIKHEQPHKRNDIYYYIGYNIIASNFWHYFLILEVLSDGTYV